AFFAKHETEETGKTSIKCISGSVEAACGLGLADGIVDLVAPALSSPPPHPSRGGGIA
ncbi:MAG: hypothetical protein SGPRY_013801, partial [Prymnesium sp.]